MKGQISDADTHVMQEVVGEAGRDRQAQQRVHNPQRDDRPIAAKHLAKEQASEKSCHRQHRTRQVNASKEQTASEHGSTAAEQRFEKNVCKGNCCIMAHTW